MHKKLIMSWVAIATFAAFVGVAAASAAPVLTSNGVVVPKGRSITAKNTGLTLFEGGFAVECNSALVTGTVTANTGTTIAIEVPADTASFTGTGAGGDCTSAFGDVKVTVNSALCLHAAQGSDNATVTGCGSEVTFTLKITPLVISCAYGTASVTSTYLTSRPATVNLKEQPAKRHAGQNVFCPAEGKLTMDFDFYTTDGTLLTIS